MQQWFGASGPGGVFARVDWDVASGVVSRSAEWFRMTGYSQDAEASDSIAFWSDRAHPDDLLRFYQALESLSHSGEDGMPFNYRLRFADGRWHQMAGFTEIASRGRDGRPSAYRIWEMDLEPFDVHGVAANAGATGANVAVVGAWSWAPGTDEVWWSKEIYDLTGWPLGEPPPDLAGQRDLYLPESLERLHAAIARLRAEGESFEIDLVMLNRDGRRLPIFITGSVTRGRPGSLERIGGTVGLRDAGAVPPSRHGPVLEVDFRSGTWTLSPEAVRTVGLLGGKPGDPARSLRELLTRASRDELQAWLDGLPREDESREALKLRTLSGRNFRLRLHDGLSGAGHALLRIEIEDDQAEVAERRDYDELTGLLSFSAFEALAEVRLSSGPKRGSQAFFMVNINSFRRVNAILGHRRGDDVLRAFAQHLGALLPGALLTRRSGDVFTGLLDRIEGESAESLAARVRLSLDSFVPPGLGLIRLRYSLAVVPAEAFDSLPGMIEASVDLLQSGGPGCTVVFGQEDGERMARQRAVYRRLAGVAARGELLCVYQPSVAAADGRTCGVEALVRWHSPDMGAVAPLDFIPIAEESGEINGIGRWVLATAIKDFAKMNRMGLGIPRISVNLSPMQFSDSDLASFALAACQAEGVDPASVVLELTESSFVDGSGMTRSAIEALVSAGFKLAMDDFGTGFSNLGVLTRLNLSHIKIDRTFVSRMLVDPASRVVVDTVIRLARGLSCGTVAEGAETEAEAAELRILGCDEVQGFLYASPMAFDDLVAWQANRPSGTSDPRQGAA